MWDEELLLPVAEINELLLGVLRARAREMQPQAPRLVAELRELWRGVDDAALARLARCPYLLLDAGFAAPACWERGVAEPGPQAAGIGYFDNWDGIAMVRHALVLARFLARSHRMQARVLLAMRPECADQLARRSLRELETLAGLAPAWIAPRWEARPLVWRQMLEAAMRGAGDELRRVQLRGLQLMAMLW